MEPGLRQGGRRRPDRVRRRQVGHRGGQGHPQRRQLYPLREPIKALGFTFVKDFNNVPGQDFWVAPADKVDLAALAALYEKWGWDATLYDGAE